MHHFSFLYFSVVFVGLKGILYYNNICDISGRSFYHVQRKTDGNGHDYAHVSFRHSVDNEYAEVWLCILLSTPHPLTRCLDALLVRWRGSRETLPRIPRIVGLTCWYLPQTGTMNVDLRTDGYQNYGDWDPIIATCIPAAITLYSSSNTVTIVLEPDHPINFPFCKKATIPISGNWTPSFNSLRTFFFFPKYPCVLKIIQQIGSRGNFTCKDTHKIHEGVYAYWSKDLIVFSRDYFGPGRCVGSVRPFPWTFELYTDIIFLRLSSSVIGYIESL